jgi:molybdate transport system substrate-binding protein
MVATKMSFRTNRSVAALAATVSGKTALPPALSGGASRRQASSRRSSRPGMIHVKTGQVASGTDVCVTAFLPNRPMEHESAGITPTPLSHWRIVMKAHPVIIAACCLLLLSAGQSTAATINLAAAASMTDAVTALIADFAARRPGVTIQPVFASSGALARQIEHGAPVDLYLSANRTWMTYLVDAGLVAADSARVFASTTLVFIGRPREQPITMADLPDLQLIAIGNPQSVPAGQYARQALEASDIYERLAGRNQLIMAQDVRQALMYAERGEVDGAFVYRTDALPADQTHILFAVPDGLHDRIDYPIALTVSGRDNDAAVVFFEYLTSPEARALIGSFGFEPAP